MALVWSPETPAETLARLERALLSAGSSVAYYRGRGMLTVGHLEALEEADRDYQGARLEALNPPCPADQDPRTRTRATVGDASQPNSPT